MRVKRQLTFAVALIAILCTISAVPASTTESRPFSIINERLTEARSKEFSGGICNSSLPLNDHLYQLIGWCTKLGLGSRCFTHGAVSCLFKKYIDIGRNIPFGDGMTRQELGRRLSIFWDNLKAIGGEIEARLAGKKSASGARFGITKFMHLSPAEFRERYLTSMKTKNTTASGGHHPSTENLRYTKLRVRRERRSNVDTAAFAARPNRVDWRDQGVVTGVKNQAACGACWAFAVTEVAETEFARKYGTLAELSVQQVTDCTRCAVCAGCRGGDICQTAGFYSGTNERIVEARLYPYVAKDATCRTVTSGLQVQTAGVRCQSFVNQEDALIDHLWQSGTAAVAVDAHMWQYYLDGTIMHNCAAELNHAVQLIGYDLASGPVPFYLVRNSWGSDWGMAGYLQIAEGSNLCGIAQDVVSFTVA